MTLKVAISNEETNNFYVVVISILINLDWLALMILKEPPF